MNRNPIFSEHYTHEGCECYKVLNPWTRFAEEKFVLCPVSEGFDQACILATEVLSNALASALTEPIEPNSEED